ncbi:MAG: PAS domain S-box protein [Methylotenera sp.]|nr:PAS domain S-box protein [Oligoflexia bacterium]
MPPQKGPRPGAVPESNLERLFELASDLMCIAGTDGFFKRVNPSFERVLGYSAAELLSRPFMDFVHPEDHAGTSVEASIISDTSRSSVCFENRYICRDGSIRWLAWQSSATPENGLIYATARDITESRRADAALRLKEAQAQATLDGIYGALPQIVWTATPDGNVDYFNQRWFDYSGMTLEQARGWGWELVIHPDDRQCCVDRWTYALSSGELYEIEYRFRRASDGLYRWHLGRAQPIRDTEGHIIKWFGTSTDIHDQKLALEASEAVQSRFSSILEQSPFATQILSIDGSVLKVNLSWQKLWNVPDAGVRDFILKDYDALTDKLLDILGIRKLLIAATQGSPQSAQSIHYDPAALGQEGRARWVDAFLNPIKDGSGQVKEVILLFNDVTESRLAALNVKEHQDRLQGILDHAPDVIFVKSLDGRVLLANQQYENTFGLVQGQIVGKTDHEIFPKEIADKFVENDQKVLKSGRVIREDELTPHAEGHHVHSSVKFPIRNAEGKIIAIGGISSDVTEQRKMEQAETQLRVREQAAAAIHENGTRLRAIFDSAFDAIVGVDEQGMLMDWNPRAEEIFGWKFSEVVGRKFSDLIIPEKYRGAHEKGMQHFLDTGERPALNRSIEIEAIRQSGEIFPIQLSVSRIKTRDGCTFTAFISDITERNRTTDALKALIASSPLATFVVGKDSKVQLWNPASERIFGWTAEEAIGKPLLFVPPESQSASAELLKRLFQGEKIIGEEARRLKKDRTEIIVNISAVPLLDAENHTYGILAILSDITAQKKNEEDLIKARDLADKATQAKSEFLANMSHEVRTPINGVVGMTGLLLDTKLTDEQKEYAETIRSSADSLLTVINDILDFSKIEAGKLDIEVVEFNLEELLQNIERNLSFSARRKGLKLLKATSADQKFTHFKGDPTRIGQILTNLVNNAIKFTAQGHVIIEANQELLAPGLVKLRFEISDTGIGIPQEALSRMFQAFSQADGSTSRRFGGTGLGLSISKQLTELMGGEIGVRSKINEGSTFWFTLTLQPVNEINSVLTPELVSTRREEDDRPVRILLAEDNMVNQKIAIRMLERAGYRVDAVANGLEVMDALRVAPYDLILMDCQMPEMDGYQATRMIRASQTLEARDIPIIAMTANAMSGDRDRCLEAGMSDYVSKPVKAADLVAVIQRALSSLTLQ